MRFIRDIIDGQRHLEDTGAHQADESSDALSEAPPPGDEPEQQDDILTLSQDFAVGEAASSEAERQDGAVNGETAVRDTGQTDLPSDFGVLNEGLSPKADSGAQQSTATQPPVQEDTQPSRERQLTVDGGLETSVSQSHAETHSGPSAELTHNSHDDLPLPLRERSGVQESAQQSQARQTGFPNETHAAGSADHVFKVPAPAPGRGSNRGARAKTRLLGFHPASAQADPLARLEKTDTAQGAQFPVGWLVVIDGPGRGNQFTIEAGVAQIGRAEGQTIRLDFGDTSISREKHAAIAYDSEQNGFFIGHGGKANLVRRNNRPVLSTEELVAGDTIRVGETTLRFVPLCGPNFSWDEPQQPSQKHAALG